MESLNLGAEERDDGRVLFSLGAKAVVTDEATGKKSTRMGVVNNPDGLWLREGDLLYNHFTCQTWRVTHAEVGKQLEVLKLLPR